MNLVVTLAFCEPRFLRACIERFRATTSNWKDFTHLVLDCAYPIPNELENTLAFKEICDEYRVEREILSVNKGVVGNYGQATATIARLYPDAKYALFFDPDSNPLDPLWAEKTLKVFAEKKCAYVALSRPTPDAPQDSQVEDLGGIPVKKITRACGWPMGSYEVEYLTKISSWSHDNPYGYGENFMMKNFKEQGRDAYMMMDVVDNGFEFLQADWAPSYNIWKVECAHHRTSLGFEAWLKSRQSQ